MRTATAIAAGASREHARARRPCRRAVQLARVDPVVDDAGMLFHRDHKALLSLLVPLAALAVSACGGDGGGTGGTGGTGGAGGTGGTGGETTTTTGGGGTGGAPMVCEGPGYEGGEMEVAVGTVSATIVDQDGQPASMIGVQVCGTDICLFGTAGDTGSVSVPANQSFKAPAFKYGDGFGYARLAVLLPAGDSTFMDIVTAKLPEVGTGDFFKPGASASSNGVVIDIAANGQAEVDPLLYEDETQHTFRAAEIPVSDKVPALDPADDIAAVWGVAPIETVFCPPATVHVPNSPGFAAGADVEFLIQGIDARQHWAPYGKWHKVSDGKVSADGKEIVTAEGQGLPVLFTFGVRLKQ